MQVKPDSPEATTDNAAWLPAWDLREKLRRKELSSVELATAYLQRISGLEPRIHAFITVMSDHALGAARKADVAVKRGESTGPLHGIPVSLKDDIWVKGTRTTCGSLLFRDYIPEENAIVAERLSAAGAVIIGKTNMPEFAAGFMRSANRIVEECRNPWDLSRTCGASSGGSAASVAAGMVPLALGSDGGGSIRLPAAFCGVVGLFPTTGLVPGYGSFTYGHCGVGPMTRDVRDAAELLQVLAGPDARDPWARRTSAQDYLEGLDSGVRGTRIAWSPDLGYVKPRDERVIDLVCAAVRSLELFGARIDAPADAAIGHLPGQAYAIARDGAASHGEGPVLLRHSPAFRTLLKDTARRALLCSYDQDSIQRTSDTKLGYQAENAPPPMNYEAAIAVRENTRLQLNRLFEQHDVLITPTFGEIAPKITADWVWPFPARYYTAYTNFANFLGLPAISVPAGMLDGLPIGMQIVGPAFSEATLLRVARAFEQANPWAHRQPALV